MLKTHLQNPLFLLLFMTLMFFYSCGTIKSLNTNDFEISKKEAVQIVDESNLNFDYLKITADINFSNENLDMNGNIDLRIKNNEYIWIAVKKLGFEVSRVLIRPDSVFVLDRINRVKYVESYSFLENYIGMSIPFSDFQQLLSGNNLKMGNDFDIIRRENNNVLIKSGNDKINFTYTINNLKSIIIAELFDNKSNKLEVSNSEFKDFQDKKIPYQRHYSFFEKNINQGNVDMNIDEISTEKHNIKFEIPSDYEKN
jgi:hypothetical protein